MIGGLPSPLEMRSRRRRRGWRRRIDGEGVGYLRRVGGLFGDGYRSGMGL
jgi:hypothetical protein